MTDRERYQMLYKHLDPIVTRLKELNQTSTVLKRADEFLKYGEMRLGLEDILTGVVEGEIEIFYSDLKLLVQMMEAMGAEYFKWEEFAPPAP